MTRLRSAFTAILGVKIIVSLAIITEVASVSAQSADEALERAKTEINDCVLRLVENAQDDQTLGEIRQLCATDSSVESLPTIKGADAAGQTPAQQRFASEAGLLVDRLGFLPHRPNLVLPVSYGEGFLKPDVSSKDYEIQFQVSLKFPFTPRSHRLHPDQSVLFFAYTGSAWWQAYNSRRSRPFREYNHSPEIFLSVPTNRAGLGWNLRSFQFGFEHQSNGRDAGTSRSWNRLFTQFDLNRASDHWLTLRSWWRIPEDAKDNPQDPEGDDNADITKFLGHNELRFGYSSDGLSWSIMLRRSLRSRGKGAGELVLSYPTGFNPKTRWTLRIFDGYGESLIDYNRRVRRIGVGFMLNDWY